jgi:hypothetical protein
VELKEWVVDGKELGSINYKFTASPTTDPTKFKHYQIWDIDYIQELFALTSSAKKASVEE